MNTFGDVKAQTRGLLGDPQGQLASDSYLAPLVNVAYSLEVLALKNATGQNLEGVVLLPDVKAGTKAFLSFRRRESRWRVLHSSRAVGQASGDAA